MHIILKIFLGFALAVLLFSMAVLMRTYHRFKECDTSLYTRIDPSEIQSGDLFLSRDQNSSALKLAIFSSEFTHVGLFHRCERTNRLFILEVGGGFHYERFEKKFKTYPGYLAVRKLKTPLNLEQRIAFQRFVDDLFSNLNYRDDVVNLNKTWKSVTNAAFQNKFPFNMDLEKPMFSETKPHEVSALSLINTCLLRHATSYVHRNQSAIFCTDFLFTLYQRLGILLPTLCEICLLPQWFVDSEPAGAIFEPIQMLKTDEDIELFIDDKYRIRINDFSI